MEPLERQKRAIEALSALSYRARDVRGFLREVVLTVAEVLAVDWVAVTLRSNELVRVMASSLDPTPDEALRCIHGAISNAVVASGRALRVEDVGVAPEHGALPPGYVAYLGVPLRMPCGPVLGTICSFQRTRRAFSDEDLQAAELFAGRAAIALENFLLYEEQRRRKEELETEVARRTLQLRDAEERAAQQARLAAIGELTATIVHEVRNPLTSIELGVDVLVLEDRRERRAATAKMIRSEAARLERLLSEVLVYARPQPIEVAELDLGAYLRELVPSLRRMPQAKDRSIVLDVPSSPVMVRADRDKLQQIFVNLVSNACEATGPGDHVRIDLSSDDARVHVAVNNRGASIDPKILPRLVEPFFTTRSDGTGLGLPLVLRIVEAHGGRLDIRSDAMTGTTVAIAFPRAK